MGLEQPLASAYMLYLYKLYRSYIFERGLGRLKGLETLEGSKIYHCQHQKRVLVLVDFQDKTNTV